MVSSSVVSRSVLEWEPGSLEIKFSVNRVFPYNEIRATLHGKSVGLFRYRLSDKYLRANGTEVLSGYQKHGIGQAMWSAALKKHKPIGVVVCTVSEAGDKFVTKLMKLYPDLEWDKW